MEIIHNARINKRVGTMRQNLMLWIKEKINEVRWGFETRQSGLIFHECAKEFQNLQFEELKK